MYDNSRLTILLVFSFFITIICCGQDFNTIVYDFSLDKERFQIVVNQNIKEPKLLENISKMFDAADNSRFLLQFSEKKSLFEIADGLIVNNVDNKYGKGILSMINASNLIYSDFSKGFSYEKRGEYSFAHLVKNDLINYNWKLINEEKIFNDLVLRKAISDYIDDNGLRMKIEAWYCAEIPFQYGPSRFSGLPGIIAELNVEIIDSPFSYTYILSEIIYDKNKEIIEIPLDKLEVLTEAKSQEVFAKLNGNWKN